MHACTHSLATETEYRPHIHDKPRTHFCFGIQLACDPLLVRQAGVTDLTVKASTTMKYHTEEKEKILALATYTNKEKPITYFFFPYKLKYTLPS